MEQSELIALLAFIGVIALIVHLVKRDMAVKDSTSDTPSSRDTDFTPIGPKSTSPSKSPTPTVKLSDVALTKEEEQKYVSIYEYTSVQSVKKCAHCDGENKYGAKVCCICGNDIDS